MSDLSEREARERYGDEMEHSAYYRQKYVTRDAPRVRSFTEEQREHIAAEEARRNTPPPPPPELVEFSLDQLEPGVLSGLERAAARALPDRRRAERRSPERPASGAESAARRVTKP
jgi:hypothetical protein